MSANLRTHDASLEALMGEIVDEFVERLGHGERPDVAEYEERYPQLATVLRQMLPALQVFHLSAPDRRPEKDYLSPEIVPEGPLGDFRIVREVGRGGMGVVYEAVQVSLGRRVALKVLPFAAALDARQLQRFQNEAQAAAHLHHQNIVPVYAVGSERGVHYYAMQFIQGRTLAEIICDLRSSKVGEERSPCRPSSAAAPSRDTLPVADLATEIAPRRPELFRIVARLGVQAAEALEHAHQEGIIHRDIKPANLLVDARGNLWITDFGLARLRNETTLTASGDLIGTLRYMSPEQALGRPAAVDHRTDVYSLGATLYELLALAPVFESRDRQELLRQIATEEPRPLRRQSTDVPAELEIIVQKALEKEAAARYATARELADDLRRFLEDKPIRARRPSWTEHARKFMRRHRSVVWPVVLAFLAAFAVMAGCVGWVVRDRAARQSKLAADQQTALKEALQLQAEGKWPQALAAAQWAETLLHDGAPDPELAGQVQALLSQLAEQEADSRLVADLEDLRLLQAEVNGDQFPDFVRALVDYREAFRRSGWAMGTLTSQEAAARLRRRPRAAHAVFMAAMDHWLILARFKKAPEASWLEEVLSLADTDPWRQRVRAARERDDRRALEQLARDVDAASQPPESLFLLYRSLRQRGAGAGALALLQQAQEAFPGDFWINFELGMALRDHQQSEGAVRFLTAASAMRPDSAGVCLQLGCALGDQGRLDEAVAACRRAIALKHDYLTAHAIQAILLEREGRLEEATAVWRKVIALKSDWPSAHHSLGRLLQRQGELAGALAALQRGRELCSLDRTWSAHFARQVKYCQRLTELEERLPAVLRGELQPASPAERCEYAGVCYCKRQFGVAARLWADAFAADPEVTARENPCYHHDAACAAIQAALGSDEDAGPPDDTARLAWRRQALEWLRADLTACGKRLENNRAVDRSLVRQQLQSWRYERDLAGLRDPAAVARLPAAEKKACQQLWKDVEALLHTTDSAK